MPLLSDKDRYAAIDALVAFLDEQDIDPYNGVPILCEVIVLACISMEKNSPKPMEAAVTRMKAASQLILRTAEDLFANPKLHKPGSIR